ncbi:ABC transporter permease [Nocardiopsis sediminis]|uniref:Transport permease protein n=1 Tax=Nocardiopsis sediminis TaxID=1778267 RepID=A0ABV8FTQ1_9ACTN
MNTTVHALRMGGARGLLEFRAFLTNRQDVVSNLMTSGTLLAVLYFLQSAAADGTSLTAGTVSLPGVLGMLVATSGLIGTAMLLATEREDGTLLRAKALPRGMLGYLVGKVVSQSLVILMNILVVLVPGLFLFDGLTGGLASGWPTLVWVLALGLAATLPIGAVLGSLFESPRTVGGVGMLPIMGLIGISGIFGPVTVLPVWVQAIAQVFPMYWLGLGMRSALLPDAAAALEIGGSWRHLETAGVLGVWALAGLVVAPFVLRRMARRESGSAVEARRQRSVQRVG